MGTEEEGAEGAEEASGTPLASRTTVARGASGVGHVLLVIRGEERDRRWPNPEEWGFVTAGGCALAREPMGPASAPLFLPARPRRGVPDDGVCSRAGCDRVSDSNNKSSATRLER